MKTDKIITIVLALLLWGVVVLVMLSCSASWHIKRAQWKDPALFTKDTVKTETVTIVKPATIDTVFVPRLMRDTTYIIQNRDSVIIRYSVRQDTVQIQADCPPSTTKTQYRTVTEKVIVEKKISWKDRGLWLGLGAAALGIIVTLLSLFIKKIG